MIEPPFTIPDRTPKGNKLKVYNDNNEEPTQRGEAQVKCEWMFKPTVRVKISVTVKITVKLSTSTFTHSTGQRPGAGKYKTQTCENAKKVTYK